MADILRRKNSTKRPGPNDGEDDVIIIKPPETLLKKTGFTIVRVRKIDMPSLENGRFHPIWDAQIAEIAVDLGKEHPLIRKNPRCIDIGTSNTPMCLIELAGRVVNLDPPGSMKRNSAGSYSSPKTAITYITVDGDVLCSKTDVNNLREVKITLRPS